MDANQMEPWRNLEPFLGADVPRNEVVLLSEVKAMCEALSHPAPTPVAVPDGWVLVPAMSASSMDLAGADAADIEGFDRFKAETVYSAMLAAAPSAPASQTEAQSGGLDDEFSTEAMHRLHRHMTDRGQNILADCLLGLAKQRDTLRAQLAERDEEVSELRDQLGRLAGEMVYRGNSVAYIYQKKDAYAAAIDAMWTALKKHGIRPDGNTSSSDALDKALTVAAEKLAASDARVVYARDLLIGAVNDIENWAGYASEYFQRKHKLHDSLAEYRGAIAGLAALSQPKGDSNEQAK